MHQPDTEVTSKKRSNHWPAVRHAHLVLEGWCRNCGRLDHLEVHHVEPFHLDPVRELDPQNLITLCEAPGVECHLYTGHLGNWKSVNPEVRTQAVVPRPVPVQLSVFEVPVHGDAQPTLTTGQAVPEPLSPH